MADSHHEPLTTEPDEPIHDAPQQAEPDVISPVETSPKNMQLDDEPAPPRDKTDTPSPSHHSAGADSWRSEGKKSQASEPAEPPPAKEPTPVWEATPEKESTPAWQPTPAKEPSPEPTPPREATPEASPAKDPTPDKISNTPSAKQDPEPEAADDE